MYSCNLNRREWNEMEKRYDNPKKEKYQSIDCDDCRASDEGVALSKPCLVI
jgi:hypothetical protein